jgi:hypothetical protein
VDQAELAVGNLGARADTELTAFIHRRADQRERGTTDVFGNVLVEDRSVLDEQWLALRREHERAQQQTRLEQWREFHLGQARSLSRTLSGMIRFHLEQARRLDQGG